MNFCLTRENSSPNDPKLRITFLLFNIDFQKVLAEFCSLKSFLYTVLSIATAKNVRQIAHSAKSLLPL